MLIQVHLAITTPARLEPYVAIHMAVTPRAHEVAISHPPIHLAAQEEYSTEDIDINWTALIELLIGRAI